MSLDRAEATYGPTVLSTHEFELRAFVDNRGLHAYAFRRSEGRTLSPVQFIRGVNILMLERHVIKDARKTLRATD